MNSSSGRPKIVLAAEDVTLAHVGRAIALGSALDPTTFDVAVACGERYAAFVNRAGLRRIPLETMDPAFFGERLRKGKPVHTMAVLEDAVRADVEMLTEEAPDLVVGDFRISLGISAELVGTPYGAIVNGYWSPASTLTFPTPEHPVADVVGYRVMNQLMPLILALSLPAYVRPFNKLRRASGLEPVGSIFEMYTHADWALYADIPSLAPVTTLPRSHSYLGPVMWEPVGGADASPTWWHDVPDSQPVVYLNGGSSGTRDLIGVAADALGEAPLTVMVATAGCEPSRPLPPNFLTAPFLPGGQAAARSDLVISNGGSGTCYQALSHGVPVLCVPSNADQYFASEAVVSKGAGVLLRAGRLTPERLKNMVWQLLGSSTARAAAEELRAEIASFDWQSGFVDKVHESLGLPRTLAGRGMPSYTPDYSGTAGHTLNSEHRRSRPWA